MWTDRLYVYCSSGDVEAVRQIAVDVTRNEADRQTFVPCNNGYFGCNTAVTAELRASLDTEMALAISEGSVRDALYIARVNNSDNVLQVAYSAQSGTFGAFGGTSGQVFTWNDGINLLENL